MGNTADLSRSSGDIHPNGSYILVVCDFDHTLIDVNSDLVLFNQLAYAQPLLPRFTTLRTEQGMGWTQIMQRQLADLATQEGYCKTDVLESLHGIKLDPVLASTLQNLHSSDSGKSSRIKAVIASDANTIFINEILQANGLAEGVFDLICTNSATWAENTDEIKVEPYQPLDSPHGCHRKCPKNMCKTTILNRARRELLSGSEDDNRVHVRIIYVGDGGNDYCPSLSLNENDLVLVREGFPLQKLIQGASASDSISQANQDEEKGTDSLEKEKVVARTKYWKTQRELGQMLLLAIEEIGEGNGAGHGNGDQSDAIDAIAHDVESRLKL